MKTLIISLNSKFIHMSPAPWYLKAACGSGCGTVEVLERTINERIEDIIAPIYLSRPDVAAFSCYIWNIEQVLKLSASVRKLLPGAVVIWGGPEVSYDAGELLGKYEFVDYIIAGEGEESFPKLLRLLADSEGKNAGGMDGIEGLAWRTENGIMVKSPAIVKSLERIPSPYTDEMLKRIDNRVVYFESSRGCPFSCNYCLSSASSGTRYFSLDRVFRELDRLAGAGARQIKFVDRTFNSSRNRALAIVKHIIDHYGNKCDCSFHFEVGADLFDEEFLQVLSGAPKGLFRIEAGVQTVNSEALAAINRKTDLDRLFYNLGRLRESGNIHIHTDLIAGLPYEDYESFKHSFDTAYGAGSNMLQLGFLKFLKGTRMRAAADEYGYRYNDFPPYEVLSGRHIGYDELIRLKGIAEMVDRYYNTARFMYSLEYIIGACFHSPFAFYEKFHAFQCEDCCKKGQAGIREMYGILYRFAKSVMDENQIKIMAEMLRFDFLSSDNSGTLPGFLETRGSREFYDRCFEFLKKSDAVAIIPEAKGMTAKQIFKKVHFEIFHFDINVFRTSGNIAGMRPATHASVCASQDSLADGGAIQTLPEEHVYIFSYMSSDRVTGRYPSFKITI